MLHRKRDSADTGERPWHSSIEGLGLFGLVCLLSIYMILNSRVPVDAIVYAVLGGVGYVFTALFVDLDRDTETLLKYFFRVFFGILLAVATYGFLSPSDNVGAALAFLIGLYPNVIFERIKGLGTRFFKRIGVPEQRS